MYLIRCKSNAALGQQWFEFLIVAAQDAVQGKVKYKQKSALNQDRTPKAPQPLRVFYLLFSSFHQIRAAQHVTHIQASVEQQDFLDFVMLLDTLVGIPAAGINLEGAEITQGGNAKIYRIPADLHLLKGFVFAAGMAEAERSNGHVSECPAAEDEHALALFVEAELVEVFKSGGLGEKCVAEKEEEK